MNRPAVVVERGASAASRSAVRQAVSYLKDLGFEPVEIELTVATGNERADLLRAAALVLLSTGPTKISDEVTQLREAFPRNSLLVATESFTATAATGAYKAGAALVAPPAGFPDAVRTHISAITRDIVNPTDEVALEVSSAGETLHPIEEQVVQDFHDPETGRLDAHRVADAYGISPSALAAALGVTQSAVSKRTTAQAAQPGLRELEFAWAVLLDAVKTPERVRAWLNAQRRDLGGKPPITFLLEGSAEDFANYIRSVVAGEPG